MPDPVGKAMGLRGGVKSSIVPGELNAFDWVRHDLRAIDASGSFVFGRCPPGFFNAALTAALAAKPLSRDESSLLVDCCYQKPELRRPLP
jgi:hypothetical protein